MENSVEFSDGQVFFDTGVRVVCREGWRADRGNENPRRGVAHVLSARPFGEAIG
jgi:hypothetical protein